MDLGSTPDGPMILCISVIMFKALTRCRHSELGSIFAMDCLAFKGSLLKYPSFVIFTRSKRNVAKLQLLLTDCHGLSPVLCTDRVTSRKSLMEKI